MGDVIATLSMEADGAVQHHAPCVPECPSCYPDGEVTE